MEGRATRRGARPKRRLAQEHGRERGNDLSGREKMLMVGESRQEGGNVVRVSQIHQRIEEGERKGSPGRRKREKESSG